MKKLNIALLGYGKMGHIIESIALSKGHNICMKINSSNSGELTAENLKKCDVAIEFTTPGTVVQNLMMCFNAGVPVVTGTTGWYQHLGEVTEACNKLGGGLFYSSNFSIGVNILFSLNERLAELMKLSGGYEVEINEIHHLQKLDKPSGTAITLAEGIIKSGNTKSNWTLDKSMPAAHELVIHSKRENEVVGFHEVKYLSTEDELMISHNAFNRTGFAKGAVLAAEYINTRKGVFTMKDLLAVSLP